MLKMGQHHDVASSVMVPKYYTLDLYNHFGFTGFSERIEGRYVDDDEERQELECITLKVPHGNSSLIVRRDPLNN